MAATRRRIVLTFKPQSASDARKVAIASDVAGKACNPLSTHHALKIAQSER